MEKYKSLVFDPVKEAALVGHLIRDKKFLAQFRHLGKPEHFTQARHRVIIEQLFRFFDLNKRSPTEPELQVCWKSEDEKTRKEILNTITMCCMRTMDFGLDVIRRELTEWIQSKYVYETIVASAEEYNKERTDVAIRLVRELASKIGKLNFDIDKEETFNLDEMFASRDAELQGASTFGLKIMDDLILPNNPQGGLLPGDLTILLAPTNAGKTSTMLTVARHNLLSRNPNHGDNRKVLLVTHEGGINDIKFKLLCCMLNVNRSQLDQMYHTERSPLLEKASKIIAQNFTYVPMNEPGQTVESVAAVIQAKQEEAIAKWGRGYDLVIDDYPAKLTTVAAKGGNMSKRNIDEYVYNYFVQLGLENKFHVLCAIQSNREGSKINRGMRGMDRRLLSMEDVMESWGPMTAATNVISVNRDPRAAAKEIITFYVCKSRSSRTGYAIAAKSNFPACMTHSETLGGIYYSSQAPLIERMEQLLLMYKNNEVPERDVREALKAEEP